MRRVAAALALGLLAAPLAAEAQQAGKVYRVGLLHQGSIAQVPLPRLLSQALGELGWVEGKNLVIEPRFAEGRTDRLPELAADLVRLNVDVIVANTNPEIVAAKQATVSVPIVMVAGLDPVGTRLIASYARPGGNVTGVTWAMPETAAKILQLLKETVRTTRRVAVVYDPTLPGIEGYIVADEVAARSVGVTTQRVEVRGPDDFEPAFATILKGRADALKVAAAEGVIRMADVIDFAARHRLPAIYVLRWPVDRGGLMSYGPSSAELVHRTAYHVDRLLKGAKPSELPVEQPARWELVINLKTAKALGLTIPQSVLIRADELIQ